MDIAHLEEAIAFIEAGDEFLLTSHINSDGDGVGGCLGLQSMLRELGKKAVVEFDDAPNEYYAFLEGWERIRPWSTAPPARPERLIVLDCPTLERIGRVRECAGEHTRILNIDHHKDNRLFGQVNLVSEAVSSSCELVYHLALAAGLGIEAEVAEQLYMGILFDTGGFRYGLTTATTLEVGADLVRRGARLDFVADQLFHRRSLEALKLLGRAIHSLRLHFGGRVTILHLSAEDLRLGDPEEVVNYGLQIQGVEMTMLLKEEKARHYRISLRSREHIDVSRIAAAFGGGGHARASGCRCQGTRQQVEKALLAEVRKEFGSPSS